MTDSTEKEREEAAEINQEIEWQPQNPGIFFTPVMVQVICKICRQPLSYHQSIVSLLEHPKQKHNSFFWGFSWWSQKVTEDHTLYFIEG